MAAARDVTTLLCDWSRGNRDALNRLLPLVYAELRHIAARQLRRERVDHTLSQRTRSRSLSAARRPASRRLAGPRTFFGVASQVTRRVLVDHARRHAAAKRGDGLRLVPIDAASECQAPNGVPLLSLDCALDRLAAFDPTLAKIVEMRMFGGLTIEEAAHVLEVSPSTAKRELRAATAWLKRELGSELRL